MHSEATMHSATKRRYPRFNLIFAALLLTVVGWTQTKPVQVTIAVTVDKEPEVQVQEQALGSLPDTIIVPPFSVTIYSYPVQ